MAARTSHSPVFSHRGGGGGCTYSVGQSSNISPVVSALPAMCLRIIDFYSGWTLQRDEYPVTHYEKIPITQSFGAGNQGKISFNISFTQLF